MSTVLNVGLGLYCGALGFFIGSMATLAWGRKALAQRYQRGKADGFLDGYDAGERGMERATYAAFQRGRAAGQSALAHAIVRDLGPEDARQFADRAEAMDKAEALAAGRVAPREPEPPAPFSLEDER